MLLVGLFVAAKRFEGAVVRDHAIRDNEAILVLAQGHTRLTQERDLPFGIGILEFDKHDSADERLIPSSEDAARSPGRQRRLAMVSLRFD